MHVTAASISDLVDVYDDAYDDAVSNLLLLCQFHERLLTLLFYSIVVKELSFLPHSNFK